MRSRWRFLFCCSLATLIGVTWLFGGFSASLPLLGLTATAGVAFAAMVSNTRMRWPAALALVGAAPMGQAVYPWLSALPWLRISEVLRLEAILVALLGALLGAAYLLIVPPPTVPDDRIPRARAV
jgi:Na+-transporting NADH:ubiquinone oxidoreductase subunit NqrB